MKNIASTATEAAMEERLRGNTAILGEPFGEANVMVSLLGKVVSLLGKVL